MKRLIVCIELGASLWGCATPEDRARWAAQEQARQEQYMNALRAKCSGYGFQPGTNQFAQCVQNEARAAEARARAQNEAEARAWRQYSCSLGNTAMCDNPPVRTNCTRDAFGNVNCVSR